MSAKTNPLAAMDRLIGNTRTMAGLTGDPQMREHLREGEEARAAVGELVKSAQVAAAVMKARGLNDEPLRAALAAFEVTP